MGLYISVGLYLFGATLLGGLSSLGNFAQMAVGLGVVIFVHELGHFLVAKACGVKCEKFYIGFDVPMPKVGAWQIPSSIFKFQYGETLYGLGIIPLGGYVKMLGQDDNPANAEKEAQRTRVAKDDAPAGSQHHHSVTDLDLEPAPLKENVDYELDPRSYTAKSVPQRMAIISAGVIMNVIFAVVFATIAYRVGVPYTPAVVGGTIPGSPAWQANLRPGMQILRVGDQGQPREELRFMQDMAQGVALHGAGSELPLLVREHKGQEPYTLRITPENISGALGTHAAIGITQPAIPTLAKKDAIVAGLPAADASVPIKAGDKIVGATVDGDVVKIEDFAGLHTFLARHADDTVTLRFERTTQEPGSDAHTQTYETEIAPRPLKTLGVALSMGPITAIQVDSPAALAKPAGVSQSAPGFHVGDVITSVNGQPIADPLLLPDQLRRLAGEAVTIGILRTAADGRQHDLEVEVTPRQVRDYQNVGSPDDPVLVDALGLTYAVDLTVSQVDANSPAHSSLQPGDKLVKFQFVPAGVTDAERAKNSAYLTDKFSRKVFDELNLSGGEYSWVYPVQMIQILGDKANAKLTFVRGGKEQTVEIAPFDLSGFHHPSRGMRLQSMEEIHVAKTWGQAFSLGLRETKESLMMVVTFLKKLVTNQISATNLGGPIMILAAGTSEASVSTSRLLIFLTMLSANLAVVNFLPIPVLDGGHMMFLLYEGIFRRPVDEKWQIRLTLLGFTFLLSLMAFVIGMDIYRFSGLAG